MKPTFLFFTLIIYIFFLAACKKNSDNGGSGPPVVVPKLSISGIQPISTTYNSYDTITGTGFSSSDSVYINGVSAAIITASQTTLIVQVPLGAGSGLVTIKSNGTVVSGPGFTYVLTTTVSTLAGNGNSGSSDGQGAAAQFDYPAGIVIDPDGNLLVADVQNYRIRKITPAGLVSTIAGNGTRGWVDGPAAGAEFSLPYGIAVDSAEDIYVADAMNNMIRKITPAGTVSTFAGNGAQGHVDSALGTSAEFSYPTGLAFDKSGNLYVADANNSAIRVITPAGAVSTFAGSGTGGLANGPALSAQFMAPAGIAFDGSGNLYVADTYNSVIRMISASGQVSTVAGNGTGGFIDGSAGSAEFLQPQALAIDSAGNILVGDYANARVRKVSTGGTVSTLAGNSTHAYVDGTIATAEFYSPWGIAVDSKGNIYVADSRNDVIRKISFE